ncbi:MAG TPA: SpoIIE family protein phosphatase, partial [Bacteroidia bacterium]|nr:SpoIIE family protein phosphatase [Bacteroidia bacterium]
LQAEKTGKEIVNYQSIIDQANDALIVIDIVDGRIHQTNPSAEALLGYTREEILRKKLFDLHPKDMLEKSSSIVADVWEKKGLIYKDIPFVKKNGEILPVECSAKVAPFAGRPAIVIYARDITERLKMENEIAIQSHIIEQKNKDITDSINYAKRIQQAILPTDEEMKEVFDDFFVYYKPKDIVSGDLYWANTVTTTPKEGAPRKLSLIAALDCTGHGVPGAFMSIVGHTILEQTLTESSVNDPGQALDYLSKGVIRTLKQKAGDDFSIKDGMDIAMCAVDMKERKLEFAGANNPLYLVRKGELTQFSGDKQPIGAYITDQRPFKSHNIQLEKGDCVYIFTDGLADQFGGPKGKKFKYKQLQQLLMDNHDLPMSQQRATFEKTIMDWMNYPSDDGKGYEQTDDMLLIGFRVN